MDAAQRKSDSGLASEDLAYLRNPIWWAGTSLCECLSTIPLNIFTKVICSGGWRKQVLTS